MDIQTVRMRIILLNTKHHTIYRNGCDEMVFGFGAQVGANQCEIVK